jgi:quercetin dioxygenase-like cupin family protein
MPRIISHPIIVEAAGNKPKIIEEFVGRPSTGTQAVSVARMRSPSGWSEPGQRPEFREITVVLKGTLHLEFQGGAQDVHAGEAVIAEPGEWIRYSTPSAEGAEYIAICLPAFSSESVNRDGSGVIEGQRA